MKVRDTLHCQRPRTFIYVFCLHYGFNPNRSLGLRRIMYLWQTVFLPFCRRRSGLRRDGTEEKTAAEGHKTAKSNNISIEIKTLRS